MFYLFGDSPKVGVGPPAGMVDQVPAHGSTCDSEKMPPVPPISIFGRNQPEVDLVDQLSGLHGDFRPMQENPNTKSSANMLQRVTGPIAPV